MKYYELVTNMDITAVNKFIKSMSAGMAATYLKELEKEQDELKNEEDLLKSKKVIEYVLKVRTNK
jgi:hypothetical protein